VAACSAGIEAGDSIGQELTTTSTTTTTTTSNSTTTTTATPTTTDATLEASLIEPSVIGVWPYRTADEALGAATSGIEQGPTAVVTRFIEDHISWTIEGITEAFEGPTMMGYDVTTSEGPVSITVRVVAFTPSRAAVWAIDFASSLDPLVPEWGPGADIAESEEGWSALIGGTPIRILTSKPGVTGPWAQLGYGEWESDLVPIGPNGASIPIAVAPDIPGVLSIWYLDAQDVVVGFSMHALPAGPFVAG